MLDIGLYYEPYYILHKLSTTFAKPTQATKATRETSGQGSIGE